MLLLGRRDSLWQELLQLCYLLLINISTSFQMIQESWVTQQSFNSIQSSLVKHWLPSTSTFTIIITSIVKIQQFLIELHWWRILQELLYSLQLFESCTVNSTIISPTLGSFFLSLSPFLPLYCYLPA